MKAIVIRKAGGPEELVPGEVPDPVPASGEALIEVHAAGVNRADLLQRQGHYDPPPGVSKVPGLEVSGRILGFGPDDQADAENQKDPSGKMGVDSPAYAGWRVGDEVCALLTGGGLAERVAVPVGQLLPVPAGVSLAHAAALPEALATVYSNLVVQARLTDGEWLLIHGGGSGIGTAAIQVARALGARPLVTVGSPRKAEVCLQLGAEAAIDYHQQDFVAEVKRITDGHGADVVLDVIGAKYLERNLRTLAADGRLAIIGLQGGAKAEIDLGALLSGRKTVMGTTLRARPPAQKARIVSGVRRELWPFVAAGSIRPVVHAVLPLDQAGHAHELLENGESIGKVLLAVKEAP